MGPKAKCQWPLLWVPREADRAANKLGKQAQKQSFIGPVIWQRGPEGSVNSGVCLDVFPTQKNSEVLFSMSVSVFVSCTIL